MHMKILILFLTSVAVFSQVNNGGDCTKCDNCAYLSGKPSGPIPSLKYGQKATECKGGQCWSCVIGVSCAERVKALSSMEDKGNVRIDYAATSTVPSAKYGESLVDCRDGWCWSCTAGVSCSYPVRIESTDTYCVEVDCFSSKQEMGAFIQKKMKEYEERLKQDKETINDLLTIIVRLLGR